VLKQKASVLAYSDSMPITDVYSKALQKTYELKMGFFTGVQHIHETCINAPLPAWIIGSSTVSML